MAYDEMLATRVRTELDLTRLRGAATWLWRRLGDAWRIVYGHVNRYPDERAEDAKAIPSPP